MEQDKPKRQRQQTNIALDREADDLMRRIVGDRRALGRYLSRLIYEDVMRRELRGEQIHPRQEPSDVVSV